VAPAPPIFITARFRSGSTMLWHLYDRTPGYCAFYEPCHDNLPVHVRHTTPKPSHTGVRSYWDAYEPILDDVDRLHHPSFGLARLYLEAADEWPQLEAYVSKLIERAAPFRAVLQFNRVDLRLPWLRARFPEARIIHLRREVRESWFSMISHLDSEWRDDPYEPHVYDLLEWCASLAREFPFLADPGVRSLYERHYLLWRMSTMAGERLADVSLDLDADFRDDPERGLARLIDADLFDGRFAPMAATRIDRSRRPLRVRAEPAEGFEAVEERCDGALEALGLTEWMGVRPLAEIRSSRPDAWAAREGQLLQPMIDALLRVSSYHRGEVTRLLQITRSQA
jgi:hypothetical protein